MEDPIKASMDAILAQKYQREQDLEEKLDDLIAQEWTPNQEFMASRRMESRFELVASEDEENLENSLTEKNNRLDDTETADDLKKIEEILRELRNFCNDTKPLHPRIYEILKPGSVLLSWYKLTDCYDSFDGSTNLKNGKGLLCLVQEGKSTTTLWYISTEEERFLPPIQCSLMEKAWYFRRGRSILLAPDDDYQMKTYHFETVEDAAKVEIDIFVAGIFGRCPILRLSGPLPGLQLKCKWFVWESESEEAQMRMLEKFQDENESEDRHVKIAVIQKDYIDNIRKKTEDFMKYVQRILVVLIKLSSKFSPSEDIKSLIYDLRKDVQTIFYMIPFLIEDTFSISLRELGEYMCCIENTVKCCQMMIKCSEIYNEYFLQVAFIHRDVLSLLLKCASLDEDRAFYDKLVDKALIEMALFSAEGQPKEEKNVECSGEVPSPSPLSSNVDSIDIVSNYLTHNKSSSGFPEYFDKLDYLLRVGNDSVFDVLCRNFKKEMLDSLLPLKKVVSINHEAFGERSTDPSFLKTSDFATEIRLSELRERPPISSNRISFAIETDEVIFCKKVTNTVILFENILTFVENSLGFKKELWMNLLKMRNIASDLPQSLALGTVENGDLKDVEVVPNEKGLTEEDSLNSDMYENIFLFPRSWDTYRKFEESDFRLIKVLGKGGYGEARLMHHYRLRSLVCKKFLNSDDEMNITKEIDMLVKLQGNKNIVRLYGFYYSAKQYFDCVPMGIVMEYVELSLHGLIHGRNEISFTSNYSLKTALEYVKDMASAFSTMHALGFYHRDIKPENVLLTYDRQIRICDFGTCGIVNKTFKTGQLGTHQYKSPEMLNVLGEDIYNEKTDVYSLTVTIWELIHRRLPYTNFTNGQISSYVYKGGRPKIRNEICPEGLKDIIQRGWAQKASDRPTMSEIQSSISSLLRALPEEVLEVKLTGPRRAVIPVDL